MKNVLLVSFGLLAAMPAFATLGVYDCTLQGSAKKASLVYYTTARNIDWMPDGALKTTKANTQCSVKEDAIQCPLFGFQDQADYLMLPTTMDQLPKNVTIYTYHDDDDQAVDTQHFDCVKYGN